DRRGNWAASWTRYRPQSGKSDFLAARSIDDGATWSIASPLHVGVDGEVNVGTQIVTDGRGEWVGVFQADLDSGARAIVRSVHFGLTDCNQNLMGAPLEIAAGISPDINGNGVPDVCEVLGLPPAQPIGCGGGLCGAGAAAAAVPCLVLNMSRLRRR